MTSTDDRRTFLKLGSLAATGMAGGLLTNQSQAQSRQEMPEGMPMKHGHTEHSGAPTPEVPTGSNVDAEYDGFSRFKPSRGNNPDSNYYLGKLVPGFRSVDAGPAPFVAPDLAKLPWKMVRGAKEFHLLPMAVEREFLPGYKMNVYGYNGSMPGPTIEENQGDRVRIIVTNELPEATTVHWHGFELPVQYDGSETLTQNPIEPGKSFVYEFDVHEEGTFFYHAHVPMQEAFGSVGWFIVHPKKVFDPPVDRDFGLIFQNFFIEPNQTIADSWRMDWNWHTINGRSGPYTTPLVVKHGERIRQNVSVDQYLADINSRPPVDATRNDPGFTTPGYPQEMKSMSMSDGMMKKVWDRREVQGMRATWPMSIMGLMTALRVLPEDLYHKVMETDEPVEKGSVFDEIVRRFGNPDAYEPAKMHTMPDMKM